jgi:hypothetical protein
MSTEMDYVSSLKDQLARLKDQMRQGAKYAQCQICRRVVYKGNARKYVDHYGDMRWGCLTCIKTGRTD